MHDGRRSTSASPSRRGEARPAPRRRAVSARNTKVKVRAASASIGIATAFPPAIRRRYHCRSACTASTPGHWRAAAAARSIAAGSRVHPNLTTRTSGSGLARSPAAGDARAAHELGIGLIARDQQHTRDTGRCGEPRTQRFDLGGPGARRDEHAEFRTSLDPGDPWRRRIRHCEDQQRQRQSRGGEQKTQQKATRSLAQHRERAPQGIGTMSEGAHCFPAGSMAIARAASGGARNCCVGRADHGDPGGNELLQQAHHAACR